MFVHMEQLGSHWTGFKEIWCIWLLFENLSRQFKFNYNLTIKTGTLREDQYTFMMKSHSVLPRMKNVSDKSRRGNQNIRFMFSYLFFFLLRKSFHLWDNVEKCWRAGQATEYNMAQEHCVLDTQGCKHTLRICSTYCSSTAAMVARTRLNM